jgi:hypothetical protein
MQRLSSNLFDPHLGRLVIPHGQEYIRRRNKACQTVAIV